MLFWILLQNTLPLFVWDISRQSSKISKCIHHLYKVILCYLNVVSWEVFSLVFLSVSSSRPPTARLPACLSVYILIQVTRLVDLLSIHICFVSVPGLRLLGTFFNITLCIHSMIINYITQLNINSSVLSHIKLLMQAIMHSLTQL